MRDIAEIRAALGRLPEGMLTDDDLARVGVTHDEFLRVVDDDEDRSALEWRAHYDEDDHLDMGGSSLGHGF